MFTVGIDIGGTKISGALVRDGEIVARARRQSPAQDPPALLRTAAALVGELAAGHPVTAVGVAAAAFLDATGSIVLSAPNLAWRHLPVRDRLADLVGLPVVLENDANAAAWGEYVAGAGRGSSADLAMVTIGTGLGGGFVHDGRLFRGSRGLGTEFGHIVVVPDGLLCGCGRRGCWECYGSGTALTRAARELAGTPPGAGILAVAGGEPVTGEHLSIAAAGDPAAAAVLTDFGYRFGQVLASVVAVLDPELIVVGGGACTAGDLLLDPIRHGVRDNLLAAEYRPPPTVVVATLGNDAGLVGAADLATRPASRPSRSVRRERVRPQRGGTAVFRGER